MFVGREKELKVLEEEFQKDSSSILVYGKRKVGKTTLILEAAKRFSKRKVIYYECIKSTVENNIIRLGRWLKRDGLMNKGLSFENNDFDAFFDYLLETGEEYLVIIDEYPYLKEYENSKKLDSIFQSIIDGKLKNITLVLSGSHISMMKDLLSEKNALFGRFSCAIELKELDYLDASKFYPDKTPYEKVGFYSVFGGSPFVLNQIDSGKSLEYNIKKLYLNNNNVVNLMVDNLLLTDLGNKPMIQMVLFALKNGKKHYKELEAVLDKDKTGNLSKMLKPLLEVDIIRKDYPINRIGQDRKAFYQINDNALRFYYSMVFDNKPLLDKMDVDDFFENFISDSLNEFISRRFEEICQDFIWKLAKEKVVTGVFNVGSYCYDDPISKQNGEFDIAIQRKNCFDVIEVKFHKKKVDRKTMETEIDQITRIKDLSIDRIGFISINGFEEDIPNLDYKFDGKDVYFERD